MFGPTKEQEQAFQNIERTGGIDLLRYHAWRLRAEGDPTAIVLQEQVFVGSSVRVALHYGLLRHNSDRTVWQSIGVGLEAGSTIVPYVRFTTGDWSFFTDNPATDYIGIRRWREKGLTEEEIDSLKGAPRSLPIDRQLVLAMKLAKPQEDYRFGEGKRSGNGKLSRHYKLLMPLS